MSKPASSCCRRGIIERAARFAAVAGIVLAVSAALGACTTTAQDIAYPDLSRTPVRPPPQTDVLTPAERDEAISEMRAEAKANSERGL